MDGGREGDRVEDRQTGKQIDRQTDRHTEIERNKDIKKEKIISLQIDVSNQTVYSHDTLSFVNWLN